MVDTTSAPPERPVTVADPVAIEFRMSALCDMDLSPGTEISPVREAGLLTTCSKFLKPLVFVDPFY
jgi:hypothetical protein